MHDSTFTSARERRLWTWTLAIVVAIFATLGLASTIAGWLPQSAAAAGFLAGMFFVGLTVLTQGLQVRPNGLEVAVGVGAATVFFLVAFRMTIPERSHLIEYAIVAAFIYEALRERTNQGRRVPFRAAIAIVATTAIGALDECVQLFLPSRVFDPVDMVFNGLAALWAVTTSAALRWVRAKIG